MYVCMYVLYVLYVCIYVCVVCMYELHYVIKNCVCHVTMAYMLYCIMVNLADFSKITNLILPIAQHEAIADF